jgi:hypothetical protein
MHFQGAKSKVENMSKFNYAGKSSVGMLDIEILSMINWREKDLVIAGYPKCGTNIIQNIVYQLHTDGDVSYDNIRKVIPVFGHTKVNLSREEELRAFDKLPSPRALKTHFPPPILPFRSNVNYLVTVRNILDVPISLMHFQNSFSDEIRNHWGVPVYNDLYEMMDDYDSFIGYFNLLEAWLPYRKEPNVLFVHFNDMKKDMASYIKKIAAFIGVDIDDLELFDKICSQCSFEWMKKNQHKFEFAPDGSRFLKEGGLIREGKIGSNSKELPHDIKNKLQTMLNEKLPDNIRYWVTNGGKLL